MNKQYFKIGYNPSGSLFVDETDPVKISDAKLVLDREQLTQLQQSINFALGHYPRPNKDEQGEALVKTG